MKLILFLGVFLMLTITGYTQVQDSTRVSDQNQEEEIVKPKLDKSRIYYGGYVTMNFSRNYSVVGAQPLVAYKLSPKLSVGAQVSYEYISEKRLYR